MNNYNFIAQRLTADPKLLEIASKQDTEIAAKFTTMATDAKREFIDLFSAIAGQFAVVDELIPHSNPGGKLGGKEKALLKERFKVRAIFGRFEIRDLSYQSECCNFR